MSSVALRASLVWHDEVMNDLVLEKPRRITLGARCVGDVPWIAAVIAAAVVVSQAFGAYVALERDLVDSGPLVMSVVGTLIANVVAWKVFVYRWNRERVPSFIIPNLALPDKFPILSPGNRGYLLTLGERMQGTICIDGEEKNVAELVRGSSSGGFAATPISGRDWGVVDLDGTGTIKLFFQFVPVEEAPGIVTTKELLAIVAGNVMAASGLAAVWWSNGLELGEAAIRGLFISFLATLAALLTWSSIRRDPESQASLAFSVVLHAALLFMTYQLYDGENPFVWPGPRSLTGNYLVTKLDTEPKEDKPTPTVTGPAQQQSAAPPTKDPPKKTATKGDEGKQGGKGDTERQRDPNAKDVPPVAVKKDLTSDEATAVYRQVADTNSPIDLSNFAGLKGAKKDGGLGFGPGKGTGVGAGEGTGTRGGTKKTGNGGGGGAENDFVTGPGKIDTGAVRPGGGNCKGGPCGTGPKEIKVGFAEPSGDFGGLTAEEIDRVVKARAGIFRACYQKELNHTPGLGGKLVIHFKIGGDGVVQSGNTATAGASTLHNDAVESCVKSNVNRLKFPAKGGIANVNYPFVFTQGG